MLFGPDDRFPAILRMVFRTEKPTPRWRTATGAGVFALIGQAPVLLVATRVADLGLISRLLLGGELLAVIAWVLLLRHWVRSSRT